MTTRRTVLGALMTHYLLAQSAGVAGSRTSTRQPKIRIGQIGTTHAHASKLSVYRRSDDYEVVGLVEPDLPRRQQAEKDAAFRDLPWMTAEELLNQPGLQAVLIETDVCDLLVNAELCVQAGMHVHIDKPAGESLSDLRTIMAIAEEKKLVVQMGYMYRYNPAIEMLRQIVADGWIGELYEVQTAIGKTMNSEDRQQIARYPGGIMFEIGCHVLDTVISLLGRPGSVHAFNKHSSPTKDSLKDNMLAVLDYPDATATIRASAIEVEGFARRHLVVCGTEGTFHVQPLDSPAATLSLSRARGTWTSGTQRVTFPKYSRYVGDAIDMARVIRGEKTFAFTYQHDLLVQEILLEASGVQEPATERE
ncbi:MAG: Gfo/Idh/MocA family protein [Planctomycetota bacterium]